MSIHVMVSGSNKWTGVNITNPLKDADINAITSLYSLVDCYLEDSDWKILCERDYPITVKNINSTWEEHYVDNLPKGEYEIQYGEKPFRISKD